MNGRVSEAAVRQIGARSECRLRAVLAGPAYDAAKCEGLRFTRGQFKGSQPTRRTCR